MPLIEINTDLEIEMPDTLNVAGQLLNRKIKIVNLQYNIENKNIIVEGVISFYDNENNVIQTNLIRPYSVRIVADNNSYCDMQGNTICKVNDIEDEAKAAAEAAQRDEEFTFVYAPMLEGKDYMKEFDYFSKIAQEEEVNIHSLIENYILKAIQENKFN